ncbi:hypothetical protein TRSC58_00692 [Trypanosoma rangeli SC58]|uniref:Uncharacterized protein n=1 Tax=Trypanosoma rangeli SC58 TaxID=429131 RepID=A0A061J9I5_TRYRA|nr:hypothetical protein TRSC58_00692 [Trypanosoma rangeli SC58]
MSVGLVCFILLFIILFSKSSMFGLFSPFFFLVASVCASFVCHVGRWYAACIECTRTSLRNLYDHATDFGVCDCAKDRGKNKMSYAEINETSAQEVEKEGLHRPLTAMKRPRPSTEDSAPLREILKAFGQRATALDVEVATCGNPPDELQAKLWTLILDIRPYVLVALTSNVLAVPLEMKKLCHAGSRRVLRYAWLALRIYISVSRIAAVVPGILLHSILTLLSLLPVLGAPCPLGKANEEILFKGIHQAFVLLSSRSPSLFQQLCCALLRDDTMGAFIFPQIAGIRCSYGRCIIKISDPPVINGVSSDAESLFVSTIVADSMYEGVCVARGLCNIMTELFESNIPFQLNLDERYVVLRLGYSVLSLF